MTAPTFRSREEMPVRLARNKFGETREIWEYYNEAPGPQAMLAILPEYNTVNPHFHRVPQFQVFLPAEGARYQKTPLDQVEVHYTDGFMPYGPFTTTVAPMEYFTLRPMHDPENGWIAYMPAERARLTRRGKRNIHRNVDWSIRGGRSTVNTLFDDEDGLCAKVNWLTKGEDLTVNPSISGGMYLLVLEGDARIDGSQFGAKSLLWTETEDFSATIQAGDDGLLLLTARFPVGSPGLPQN